MKQLIEALNIFAKYADENIIPTGCEYEEFRVYAGIVPEMLKEDEIRRLAEIGFFWSEYSQCFVSYKYADGITYYKNRKP